jgi:hypothetical protein
MHHFLHKLYTYLGESVEVLHDHLKYSKVKIPRFGIDLNSCQVVMAIALSFKRKPDNCGSDNAYKICSLKFVYVLCSYLLVSLSIEDLEGGSYYII